MNEKELGWDEIQILWKKEISVIFEKHKDMLNKKEVEIFDMWLKGSNFKEISEKMIMWEDSARSIHSETVDKLIKINKEE